MKIRATMGEAMYILFSLFFAVTCILRLFTDYRVVMYILIGLYIWLFILTLRDKNFSIYQVFLITYFVFLLGRVFLNCFGLYDMKTLSMLQHTSMTDEVALLTLEILSVFLIGTSYAWLVSRTKTRYDHFNDMTPKILWGGGN